jgi:hypothetical protein
MLDNGYSPAASTTDVTRPQELAAPTTGESLFNATRGARAEQAAALAFDHVFGSVTCRGSDGAALILDPIAAPVAHIVPTAHPGPNAPLGWSLSQFARDDLTYRLLHSPANLCQIALVRSWFRASAPDGAARCLTGFVVRASTTTPVTGPSSVTTITTPIGREYQGQAGVTIKISPSNAVRAGRASATTDASGRFYLIVTADRATRLSLTAYWGNAFLEAPVPPGTTAVETSVNFRVAGPSTRSQSG